MSRAQFYVIGQFALFALLGAALLVFSPGQTPILRVIGLGLIVSGFVVIALAIREHAIRNAILPNITPTPNAQTRLVESGVYARIRHPIYSGVLLGALGVALAHGHFGVVLVALVLVVFFTFKSRYEEQLLRTVYPQYSSYMTRTGRFLPFLTL
jgi:protein-S-isoprenylcysteine O-methyltransferase Ste14